MNVKCENLVLPYTLSPISYAKNLKPVNYNLQQTTNTIYGKKYHFRYGQCYN